MAAIFTAPFSSIQLNIVFFYSIIDAAPLCIINSMLHLLPHSLLSMAQQPLVGQGPLIIDVLRSHSDTYTVGVTPQDE